MLKPLSILLWGEISAASNQSGICEEANHVFAMSLNVDIRSIVRYMTELVENGHIVRLEENGKRKIKVLFKALPVPDSSTYTQVEELTFEKIRDFAEKLLSTWEHRMVVTITDRQRYYPEIKRALKEFSEDEILKAVEKRIEYVREWSLIDSEASNQGKDINLVLSNILPWLKSK